MSMTLIDLINENLEFKYDIYDLKDGERTEDTKINYSFEVHFKKGTFKHEAKGEFLFDILNYLDEKIEDALRNEINEKIEDLILF